VLLNNSASWYCHVISVDSAGNWSTVSTIGPLLLHSLGVHQPGMPEQYSLNVYPNPTNSAATLALSGSPATVTRVQVYNMLGRAVSSFTMDTRSGYTQTALDVHDLPEGMYEVRAVTPEKTLSADLLVTK